MISAMMKVSNSDFGHLEGSRSAVDQLPWASARGVPLLGAYQLTGPVTALRNLRHQSRDWQYGVRGRRARGLAMRCRSGRELVTPSTNFLWRA